jgi:hypothetical protein
MAEFLLQTTPRLCACQGKKLTKKDLQHAGEQRLSLCHVSAIFFVFRADVGRHVCVGRQRLRVLDRERPCIHLRIFKRYL